MTDIKWIKLSVNMFNDEKIKLIRTMPEGDKIIVIWVQLLCLAGKTNDNGSIYMGQHIYYTDEMLATLCDQPLNIMRIAISTLEQFGMIEKTQSGVIEITNWEKHQNIDGMEKIKEKNAERQQIYYYRKKIKQIKPKVVVSDLPGDVDALKKMYENLTLGLTLANGTEKELELEEELEEEKESNKDPLSGKPDGVSVPYQEIISYLNDKAGKKFKVVGKHKDLIKARWNEGQRLEDFKTVIDNMAANWKGLTFSNGKKAETFLQPSTLFGNKFEEYRNQTPDNKPTKPTNELDWE